MFINTFLWSFFLTQMYRQYNPDNYNLIKFIIIAECNKIINPLQSFSINLSYKLLYFYSVMQIFAYKSYNKFKPHLLCFQENLNKLLASEEDNHKTIVNYYLHGKLIKSSSYIHHCNLLFLTNTLKPEEYDLITLVDKSNNNVEHANVTSLKDIQGIMEFSESNIKFLSFVCNYNGNDYNIDLKTNKLNFYMNKACIDKYFIKYYLKNILNYAEDIDINTFKYTLNLIDHNVNIHNLTTDDYIILQSDNYQLIRATTNTNKETNEEINKENNDNSDEVASDKRNRSKSSEDYIKLDSQIE